MGGSVSAALLGMLGTRVPPKLVLPLGGKRQVRYLVIIGVCTPTEMATWPSIRCASSMPVKR